MNTNNNPREIHRVIANDITRSDLFSSLKKEISELKEYMLSEEEKVKMDKLGWFKRSIYFIWHLLVALIYNLTPIRRLLLIFAIILLIFSNGQSSNTNFIISIFILIFIIILELKDKLLAKEELEAGRVVQKTLMPETSPEIKGWRLWLYSKSANDVGGDLIDFIQIDDRQSAIAIGDVSGKGLRAALHAAKLQATIRALLPEYDFLSDLACKINTAFKRYSMKNFFATMVLLKFDSESSEIKFVNAGHLPPIFISNGNLNSFPKGDAALGILANPTYQEHKINFNNNDWLIVYSDGITEAKNPNGDFYGEDRLKKILNSHSTSTTESIGNAILNDINNFIDDARINDDITVAIIKKII